MNLQSLIPFAFVALILGFAVLAIAGTRRQQRKTVENLTGLGGRLALEVRRQPAKFGFEPPPTVEGRHRERPVRFFNFSTGSGKSRTNWSAVSANIGSNNDFTLELAPENFLTRIGAALGMQDIKVGDPDFDRAFVVRSNDAAYVTAALLPEIRARILREQEQGAHGHLRVKAGVVRYAEVGGFDDAARVDRLAGMLEVVCDLAEVAEVYQAEKD
jgi:hypothetical protein